MRSGVAMILFAGLLLVPDSVSAQTAAGPLEDVIGQRVRVWTFDGRRLEGTLVETSGGAATLEILDEEGVAARESVAVARARVYAGQRRSIPEGVLLGALGGGVVGRLLCALNCSSSGGTFTGFSLNPWGVAGAFALIGAPIGLLIGASRRSDVWKDRVVPTGPVLGSGDGLVRIGVRIPFH
jgi:hypothetical protein